MQNYFDKYKIEINVVIKIDKKQTHYRYDCFHKTTHNQVYIPPNQPQNYIIIILYDYIKT